MIRRREITITSEPASKRTGALSTLLRRHFWPHRTWFIGGTLFALGAALAGIGYIAVLDFVGQSLQKQIQGGAGQGFASWIGLGIGAIIGLTLLRSLSIYAMTLMNNTGVQRGLTGIQAAQFDALIDGDYARVAGDASGAFVSRFINDVIAIREAALRFANNFTKSAATVIGVLIWLIWKDWQLALIIAVVYPLALGPVIAIGNAVRLRSRRAQQQSGEVTAMLTESFQSARIVKAFGLETWLKGRGQKAFAERSRLFLKVLSQRAGVDPVLEVAGGLALAGILGFVAWRISQGTNTLGDLLGVIGAVAVAAPEVRALGSISGVAQEGSAAAERVLDLTEARALVQDAADARTLGRVQGGVEFADVSFAYADGARVLNDLNFKIAPGETVAIVGPSGAGKSTVFNLLLRLYDPMSGAVKIDGEDVRAVSGASLRANMALVAQDAVLFDDSVKGNIALGRLGASEADIEAAARAAQAPVFVLCLPDGYATGAGGMGGNLAGGQRPRLALARAFLRDAPILLLDEATSALDAQSEAAVQSALSGFMKGRTTLIIAHRLSTVRAADRILVMQGGRVVESGTHEELVSRGGLYKELVDLQLS